MSSTNTKRQGRNPWKKLLGNIKISGRMRDAHCDKKPRVIAITWEELRDIFIDQQAKCYWFGMELDPDGIFKPFNPMAISADRLDDNEDYVKGNVVICSRMANLGRGKCSAEEFRGIVRQIRQAMIDNLFRQGVMCHHGLPIVDPNANQQNQSCHQHPKHGDGQRNSACGGRLQYAT